VTPVPLLFYAAALAFIFGWNNGSFLVGNLTGSGTLTLRSATLLAGISLLVGALVEGPKMTTSLVGSLAPVSDYLVMTSALLVTILLLLVLSSIGRPMSLIMTIVGAFLGATYGAGLAVSAERTALVIGFWFAAPFVTGLMTYGVYVTVRRAVSNMSLITVSWMNKVIAVISAFLVSYTLGANNIGLLQSSLMVGDSATREDVFALLMVAVILALLAALGIAVFGGGGVSGTIGDRMLALSPQGVMTIFISCSIVVWVGTQFALPISMAQCVLGGMFGAGFARKPSIMNRKLIYETVLSWAIVPSVAFAVGVLSMRL
jgi:PiT family inorganic phosphate transporter